jgi:hypothetical protein
MPGPDGFGDLVKMAMKERPAKPKDTAEIWEKFLRVLFLGGKRSDPEITFLIKLLNDIGYVQKTDGDDWRDAVSEIIRERSARIKDDDILLMLKEFEKELFKICASIKGSARYFAKNDISPKTLETMLLGREKTWEFIEGLAQNEDVSNVKYTKIILWLHSIGYGEDFVPPSWQTKKFVNDEIGPYYQFYDDDKYFMQKAQGFAQDMHKAVRGCTARDVAAAIFYYASLKGMLPPRSPEKKRFNPRMLLRFLKSRKMTLRNISEKLSDFDERQALIDDFNEFVFKEISK